MNSTTEGLIATLQKKARELSTWLEKAKHRKLFNFRSLPPKKFNASWPTVLNHWAWSQKQQNVFRQTRITQFRPPRSKRTGCSKVPFKIIYLLIKTLCLNCAFFVQSLYEAGVGMVDKANNPYTNMQSCFEKLVDMRGYLSKNEDEITEVKLWEWPWK